jgi:uncharacterized protein (TIGR01244 family)
MSNSKRIDENFTVAGQVSAEELEQASQAGFKSVLNLRSPNEPGFLNEEPQLAEDAGLEYAHTPLAIESAEEQLSTILAELDKLPKPTLIHCAGGGRASVIALSSLAERDGLTPEQALAKAQEAGIDYSTNPKLKQLLEQYIANHIKAKA